MNQASLKELAKIAREKRTAWHEDFGVPISQTYAEFLEAIGNLINACDAPVKVFSMNDCDWMAGETLEACKEAYLRQWCGDGEDAFDDAHEVPADKMLIMQFDDHGTKRSFREQLDRMIAAGETFPTFFASTEY